MSKNTSIELFNFNAEHNGEKCIESLKPEDRGTNRQYRFTIALFAVCFECKYDTIKSRIQTLINTGDLDESKNLESSKMPYSNGSLHDVTLYDLEVFNKLAMTFIDNPRAVQIRNVFSDVLVKYETRPVHIDSYMIDDRVERAKVWIAEQEETMRVINGLKEDLGQAILERNIALVEKRRINEKRVASACATAAKYAIKCQKLEKEIKELIGQKTFPFWDGNLKLV